MFLRQWKDNFYLTYKWRSVHDNLLGKLAAYPDTRQGICSSWILINSNIWCRVRSMKSSPNKMQNTIANWTQTLGPTHIYLVSDNITFFFRREHYIQSAIFSTAQNRILRNCFTQLEDQHVLPFPLHLTPHYPPTPTQPTPRHHYEVSMVLKLDC